MKCPHGTFTTLEHCPECDADDIGKDYLTIPNFLRNKDNRVAELEADNAQLQERLAHAHATYNAADRGQRKAEAENELLKGEAKDSEMLFGAGWQETLKGVHGDPSEFAHSQVTKLAGDVAERDQQLTIARVALEWYANRRTYVMGSSWGCIDERPVDDDKGEIAREALEKMDGK